MKLDIGCGPQKQEGFLGVDKQGFEGVDYVMDVREPWPWDDASVDEVYCAHFVEHLTGLERCHFWNELYRVLKPGAKAVIIVPHWGNGRAYGDPTHQWPPMSEFAFYYLRKEFRDKEAPHTNELLNCDFEAVWGYLLNPALNVRAQDFQQFAVSYYREAIYDIHATLTKN